MTQLLQSFHVWCARHLTRLYIHRKGDPENEEWVYPSAKETLAKAGLKPIMTYVRQRRGRFHHSYLRSAPSFSASKRTVCAGHVRDFPRFHQHCQRALFGKVSKVDWNF